MVVVSGSWVKNVATYPTQVPNDDVVIQEVTETMAAKAVLICRPNSHKFQDRTLTLDQPVKVGRSVARAKPTPTNAIFDCKVLSRHHALLWYENGKFYLQDTKSSNGTFVNNNRLTAESENHEVSSGDIVQFGVDVVENNRKVTHGCIIATLKLYLSDGKEAKASPSITEGDRHGVVPLDDLYKLNEILQEANQREQCLESKLAALQHVVLETRKSAEESWQAYVGEERLLSRLSALETQLQQASKNWSEDRLKEEIAKLRENKEQYQEAAKGALEKVHAEKLEAVSIAMEQERAKISAEQDAFLAKEQLALAQLELQEVAQKLTEIQRNAEVEKMEHEAHIQELELRLEEEEQRVIKLQAKVHELTMEMVKKLAPGEDFEQHPELIFSNDRKTKEEILAENDIMTESILNKSNSNGIEQNHINLVVAPVDEKSESEKAEIPENESEFENETQREVLEKEDTRKVTFNLQEDVNEDQSDHEQDFQSPDKEINEKSEKDDYNSDHVDSKTLKYQFQSVQNEFKRKIEILETTSNANRQQISDLTKSLAEETLVSGQRLAENENLKEELGRIEQKWKESCNESQQLKDMVGVLTKELEETKENIKKSDENERKSSESKEDQKKSTSNNVVMYEQLVNVEEELVTLKERFAKIAEDKIRLQRDLLKMTEQYNIVCNSSYNKYFFYVAPLVLMVLYLLISAMIS